MKMPRPLLATLLLTALLLAALPAFAQQTRIADLPAQASQGALIIGRAVPGVDSVAQVEQPIFQREPGTL